MKDILLAAFLAGATVTVAGCSGNSFTYPPVPSDAQAGNLIREPHIFKTAGGKYRADVGTIVVPENRSRPGSRMIRIPVVRIHSSSSSPLQPIFALTGGPGMSNMNWTPLDSLLARHDFIMVGYRGVDGSVVLDAPEVAGALSNGEDFLGEQNLRTIALAWKAAALRLREAGVDLEGYSMLEVIEDLEDVREAFRYERINLLSESYGTRVAYLYGLRHPERVHRSAMIGANPPGRFVWEAGMVDRQLQEYAQWWAQNPDCLAESKDLMQTMKNVSRNMPAKWLWFPINPGKVKVVSFAMLFNRKSAAMVFDAWVSAENGDASGLALMSMAYDFVLPSMFVWGDLASKSVGADLDKTRNLAAELDPDSSVFGSPLARLLWVPLASDAWPMASLPEEYRVMRRSNVETLLLSGTLDFSTPAQYATQEMLPFLPKGKQILLPHQGHVADVWTVNPEATSLMLTSFYRTGVPDTSLNRIVPLDLEPGWRFPTIAKIALGACVVAAAAVIAGVLWLGRLIQSS